jgi:predicted nucleotidyltransferase
MKPSDALRRHRSEIRRVVEQYGACNARVFGSVVHGNDSDDSDLDLLVEPIDGKTTLTSLVRIKRDLESITGVPVDVVTPMALQERMRQAVIAEAVPV